MDDGPTQRFADANAQKRMRSRVTFARWGLVGAILMLFVLATVGAAQSCQFESNLSPPIARSAAQIGTQRSAIGSAVTTFAVVNISVGSLGAYHCNGLCCAGTCGAACSTGLIVECSISGSSTLQSINITFVHTPLPLTKSDAPFRPPRLFI